MEKAQTPEADLSTSLAPDIGKLKPLGISYDDMRDLASSVYE